MDSRQDSVLKTLLDYAVKDDTIRAVLMEGSRAFGTVDRYSDYDIVFVTRSSEQYFDGKIIPFLLKNFGEIAVMQTPDNGDPRMVYTHLIQFSNGVRIDLTFNSIEFLAKSTLESATAVLLDKDARFKNIPLSSDADFWIQRPSEEQFHAHCNEFWWCAPYVAKAVARGQLLHGLEILNERIRPEYTTLLSFLAGVRGGWEKVNPGKHCTNIQSLLPLVALHFYDALLDSYVPAQADRIAEALTLLMEKYHSLAAMVGRGMEYTYHAEEGEKVMAFIRAKFRVE